MVTTTTITTTTSTTTVPLSTLPMSLLSSNPETSSAPTSSTMSIDVPGVDMQPFTPRQCLFCPNLSPSFTDSVMHMQKSHGLFVPDREHLVVDLETLFKYLHLIISGYRECIQCGTERATVQAVQQHMTGKGHCRFDISEDSEFAQFYDFSESEDNAESDIEGNDIRSDQDEIATNLSPKPVLVDEDSIRLPSGKIISKHSSTQAGPSSTQLRRRTRTSASRLEYSQTAPSDKEASGNEELDPDTHDTQLLSKREKRERAMVTYQLANMSANDRSSLMHLPTSQQRSILATQYKQAAKIQKEERRRQGKIDRKGNKNLYAYWNTETPVYQCG
ncbi:C2H2 type zinc-finger-domain-containing protein [Xylogone sp. PMI_703]|nr:C2H2 type zinc-finger-domain-containing protein [Xylogone sp. PMI_703]